MNKEIRPIERTLKTKVDELLKNISLTEIRNLLTMISINARVKHKLSYFNMQRLFNHGMNINYWEDNKESFTKPDKPFLIIDEDIPLPPGTYRKRCEV